MPGALLLLGSYRFLFLNLLKRNADLIAQLSLRNAYRVAERPNPLTDCSVGGSCSLPRHASPLLLLRSISAATYAARGKKPKGNKRSCQLEQPFARWEAALSVIIRVVCSSTPDNGRLRNPPQRLSRFLSPARAWLLRDLYCKLFPLIGSCQPKRLAVCVLAHIGQPPTGFSFLTQLGRLFEHENSVTIQRIVSKVGTVPPSPSSWTSLLRRLIVGRKR